MLAGALGALGCAETGEREAVDASEQAVLNGAPATTEHPAVMHLMSSSDCSATLVAPTKALTAAHCVWDRPLVTLETFAASGERVIDVLVADVAFVPAYTSLFSVGYRDDLAVLTLARPVQGVKPIPILPSDRVPPTWIGVELLAVGWGETGGGSAKAMGALTLDSVDGELLQYTRTEGQPMLAPGDSGGAGLLHAPEESGDPFLAAVIAKKRSLVSIDAYRSFVESQLRSAACDESTATCFTLIAR